MFCVTRALTWLISQKRFWDVASVKKVRQELRRSRLILIRKDWDEWAVKHKTNHHLLTASKKDRDMLLITELLPHEGQEEDAAAMPVACFKAPQRINWVRCHGAAICVACEGGAVCFLQAPFLAA